MRVAVDFDGTIAQEGHWPQIGKPIPGAIETVKRILQAGHDVYLWTARTDDRLRNAIDWCADHGLRFTGANVCAQHPPMSQVIHKGVRCIMGPKLLFDVCIDDRNICTPKLPCNNVNWLPVINQLYAYNFLTGTQTAQEYALKAVQMYGSSSNYYTHVYYAQAMLYLPCTNVDDLIPTCKMLEIRSENSTTKS